MKSSAWSVASMAVHSQLPPPPGRHFIKQHGYRFLAGDSGNTFGGNPSACAAGTATIKTILDETLLDNSARMGEYCHGKFAEFCQKYHFIDSPRGIGLMQAVNVQHNLAPAIVQQALTHGLLLNNLGPSTLRMVPPLNLSREDAEEAAELLDLVLADVE